MLARVYYCSRRTLEYLAISKELLLPALSAQPPSSHSQHCSCIFSVGGLDLADVPAQKEASR